jgi:hypothetical protein
MLLMRRQLEEAVACDCCSRLLIVRRLSLGRGDDANELRVALGTGCFSCLTIDSCACVDAMDGAVDASLAAVIGC